MTRTQWNIARRASGLVLLVLAGACAANQIDGTTIADTEENRAIYDLVQAYREAIEQRDVHLLASLISPNYFENSSTTATDVDDYGYEALREKVLPLLQDNIKAVQYRIRLTRIEVRGDRASADFEFWLKFLYAEGGREGWRVQNNFNRLEFLRGPDGWKISGGL
jgi:hypothetical protein